MNKILLIYTCGTADSSPHIQEFDNIVELLLFAMDRAGSITPLEVVKRV